MKTYLNLALSFLMLIGLACGHNIQKPDSSAPTIKFQPRLFYPKAAQKNAYFGTSKVIVQISKTGMVDKAFLVKSSGYPVLDSSAVQYCKDITFFPAKKDGEMTDSRMALNIKFDLSNNIWNPNEYITEIRNLQNELKKSDSSERNLLEKEILNWHNEFVDKMKDVTNFNSIVEQVISSGLANEWKKDWNTFPLSFLLYHDFIQNYRDYNDLKSVKSSLVNALKCDIYYITSVKLNSAQDQQKRDILLNKIKTLVINNYPEISIEDLGFSKISS